MGKPILLRRNEPNSVGKAVILGEEKDPVYRGGRGNKKPFYITGREGKVLLRESAVIEALESHGGLITHAARALKCPYKKLRRYIDNNPSVQKVLDTIKLVNVERAERKLRDLVEAGHLGAICFTLKCQGRERGWVENVDVVLPDKPITFRYVPATPPSAKGAN